MSGLLRNNAIYKFMVVGSNLFIADGFFGFPKTILCNAEILFRFGRVS